MVEDSPIHTVERNMFIEERQNCCSDLNGEDDDLASYTTLRSEMLDMD